MPKKMYAVHLPDSERISLQQFTNHGKPLARQVTRARIFLLADAQWPDEEIAEALQISRATVYRIRKRYSQEGLEPALQEKPRPGAPRKVDSRLEVQLTMLACSEPPEGHSRWTLRLLADKVVELACIATFSHTTVRRIRKKTPSNLG